MKTNLSLYRHDEIMTYRPYAFDVDPDGWLWEGCGSGRLTGHNIHTGELRIIPIPEMGQKTVYQVFAWEGKLVLTLGFGPNYLVYDLKKRQCNVKKIPAAKAIVWYGTKTPNDKVILYERSESKILILDSPNAKPRVVQCPFGSGLAYGNPCSDGFVYSFLSDPARQVRFDLATERFIDEKPLPFPDSALAGNFEHKGIYYAADSVKGRILALDLATQKWLDPIPTPDYGALYGYMGGGFGFQGKGYFCLSNYTRRSRLDLKTGQAVAPEGNVTLDGKAIRFLERYLVFDAETRTFDYLVAPAQPDGIPLLCYNWTDGKQFVITGIVIPFAKPGEPGEQYGPWLVLQSAEADAVPGFGPYDLNFRLDEHTRKYRRSYRIGRSLYLPEEPHTPAITNMEGPATQYPPGVEDEFVRRAAKTNPKTYWKHIIQKMTEGAESESDRIKALLGFVHRHVYYNPIQNPKTFDPIVLMECHDLRCGQAMNLLEALFASAKIKSRKVNLNHHGVTETFYDGSWHVADVLFFNSRQPARDGRVLSVEELKANPYYADGCPQPCFAYDPEQLLSEDAFQVLGYVFGPWGSYEYYSYYLGAEKDHPPTIPTVLPVKREGGNRVRLRWSESVKMGGGAIEYEARVFADRGCTEQIFRAQTKETSMPWEVPEQHRMYFIEVRAMDDHRQKNPDTWYPPGRWNFVLVPSDQYGWYGVM